jgi:periplasmic divalent cation tolerance protein
MEMSETGCQALLILTNLPDADSAQALATTLVSERLAACVNVLAPCRSVYRWQGAIESAQEVPLLIKTTAARYADLEAAIRAAHPYELPEIIAVPIAHGLPEYLDWVVTETCTETLAEAADGKLPT